MPIDLGAPRADFVGSHELIPVILGATAFLDDLARCADEPSSSEAPVPATDGLLVDALLGLLAVRRGLRLWIEAAEDVTRDVPPSSGSSQNDESYLR